MKNQPVVVVRKRRGGKNHSGHGGAWKIAYADFMTAMMAFFLVMWLLSIASPQELTTIAEYFRTPLDVALTGGARSSDDSSPIPGGGDDPTRQMGDVHKSINQDGDKLERKRLNQLRERLDQLIESDPRLRVLRPQLLINLVSEGLQIQILDSQNRPMFETGSALVEPYMRDVLRGIAPILNDIPNKISISGHTDSVPYVNGGRGYSNWELSADRANASRRELISGGLAEGKVLRVVGMAATMSLVPQQPDAAINRRISLLVLNRQTEEMIEHENAVNPNVVVNHSGDLSQQPAFNQAARAHGDSAAPSASGGAAAASAPANPPSSPAAVTGNATTAAGPGGAAPATPPASVVSPTATPGSAASPTSLSPTAAPATGGAASKPAAGVVTSPTAAPATDGAASKPAAGAVTPPPTAAPATGGAVSKPAAGAVTSPTAAPVTGGAKPSSAAPAGNTTPLPAANPPQAPSAGAGRRRSGISTAIPPAPDARTVIPARHAGPEHTTFLSPLPGRGGWSLAPDLVVKRM
ncbi:flagellar motor protein MotB [Martelella alba]|uniref:Flagellar motor protein MotB n=1 Tax=Martelella alba TaxID=2590451 RepID=A0ABY2SQD4_9HYPH|nr:flagellar motor protein MotB [Martelella alba]TKI08311.1 flagellar motor protein MotB [Martelella alba]